MKKITLLLTVLFLFGISKIHSQIITTVAGNGTAGYYGDGGQATAAELDKVGFVLWDASGNMYISDSQNGVIRKVNSSGVISTIAGNGTNGYSGDGGQATAAELDGPEGMAIDASGNLYIGDMQNSRIRKINTSGVISTFAGNGTASYSGDGGQATAAELNKPDGIVFDASGNMYIGDQNNNRVRKVNTSGVISTFAGTGVAGFSGNGGQATAAELNKSTDVAIDGSGNFYIADFSNNRIRKVNSSGVISTVVGNGTAGFSGDGGQATAAEIDDATCKVDGSGNIYITDRVNNRERKVNTSGVISTICGNATAGYTGDGGQATAAELNTPFTCAFDNSGNLYIADHANNVVRVIYLTLNVTATVTGNVSCNGGSNGSSSSTVTHGTTPYAYSWTGGGTNSTYTGLTAGTYTLTVTDADGITGTATATITQPTALSVTATTYTSSVCAGKKDTLKSTPSGGTSPYTYLWTPQAFGDYGCNTCQNSWVYPFGTTYTMMVTDSHGCTATASTSITINPYPYTSIVGPISPTCASNTDTLVATGGTSYTWSNSATTSAIIVSPSVSTTYSVVGTNTYGCRDSAYYTIDTDCIGNGNASTTPIRIVPSTSGTTSSFSTNDSALWFYFVPTDSNNQVVASGNYIGMAVPHVHRLTLYDSTLHLIEDRHLGEMNGANELVIDAQHLHIGKRYLVRAARTPADSSAGCNPTPHPKGVCHAGTRWGFQMTFRTVPVFVPDDSGNEAPSINQVYFEGQGQVEDMNKVNRYDIKAYTNSSKPTLYLSDSAVSFVINHLDSVNKLYYDTAVRVDMYPTGSGVQPFQRPFKMQKDTTAGYLNYFIGHSSNGFTNIYGYSRVVYKNIYTNVDMHLYSNNLGTKFYFVCNPASGGIGAGNPANIQLQFKGASSVNVLSNGGLQIVTSLGDIVFAPGTAYTDSLGIIKPMSWQAKFVSVNSTTVEFNTGTYNTSEPLVIRVDRGAQGRVLSGSNWITYYGGTVSDEFRGLCFDNIRTETYACGDVQGSSFPGVTGSSVQSAFAGGLFDAVAVKFNSGHQVEWATYYGGSNDDIAHGVAYNNGHVYLTGYTNSPNFLMPPTQPAGAFVQTLLNNGASLSAADAFVVDLNSNGNSVNWATFYGGANNEVGNGITYDIANDDIYVVGGQLDSYINPTIPTYPETGAYNSTTGLGFILRFNSSYKLIWATDIGSHNGDTAVNDELTACTNDGTNLYVTGRVDYPGYPVKNYSGPQDGAFSGCCRNPDAVITAFDLDSNAIVWSDYYGGDGTDEGLAICVSPAGGVIITGRTSSPGNHIKIPLSNPGSPAYYQDTNNNGTGNDLYYDAFIAKFAKNGAFNYGTYFGGNSDIWGLSVTADYAAESGGGNYYITGQTLSGGMKFPSPNTAGPYIVTTNTGNYDAFIAGFGKNYQYVWGTYLGGSGADYGYADVVDFNNHILYDAGQSNSTNFPVNQGGGTPYYQDTNAAPAAGNAYISAFSLTNVVPLAVNNLPPPSDSGINVYPNPTAQSVTVQLELNGTENLQVSLCNVLGEVLYYKQYNDKTGVVYIPIDLSSYADATYIVKVSTEDKVFYKKVIKLH